MKITFKTEADMHSWLRANDPFQSTCWQGGGRERTTQMAKRNSGRTSAMLHKAVAMVLEGGDVMVVAATREQAEQMFRRVANMQTPQAHSRQGLTLEYGGGRLRFCANTTDRQHERGYGGTILTDHYVFDKLRFTK